MRVEDIIIEGHRNHIRELLFELGRDNLGHDFKLSLRGVLFQVKVGDDVDSQRFSIDEFYTRSHYIITDVPPLFMSPKRVIEIGEEEGFKWTHGEFLKRLAFLERVMGFGFRQPQDLKATNYIDMNYFPVGSGARNVFESKGYVFS